MCNWQTRRLGLAIVLALGVLLAGSLIPGSHTYSAPPAQDATLNLDYGNDVTKGLEAIDENDAEQPYTFQVNVPAGADLTVWVGEGKKGGCSWKVTLYHNGVEVGHVWSGMDAGDWSDPLTATISTGSAQATVVGRYCSGPWEQDLYVRFRVSGTPQPDPTTPTFTPTATPTPELDTPTPPPAQPTIEFWADHSQLRKEECTWLHWRTQNVNAVHYQGRGVVGNDDSQECPQQTTTYVLRVETREGAIVEKQWTVVVEEPTPTPTWTPTPKPPTPKPRLPTSTPRPPTPTPRPPTSTPRPTPTPTRRPTPTRQPTPTPTRQPTSTPTRQPTSTPTRQPTSTPTPWPPSTPLRVPTPTPLPFAPMSKCDPSRTRSILIVTDSRKLGENIGVSEGWDLIRPQLESLYERRMEGCDGLPLFLDLTDEYLGGGYHWPQVSAAIRTFINTEMGGNLPSAIAVIGGSRVVPMAELTNSADNDTLYTDDVYADFDQDGRHLPDVPIARLPDGYSLDLIQNYIRALSTNVTPPEGSTVYAGLTISLERTTLGYSGSVLFQDSLSRRGGPFVQLVSPPWGRWGHSLSTLGGAASLLWSGDTWNMAPTDPAPLNVTDLLFNLYVGWHNSAWWAPDPMKPITDPTSPVIAFDVSQVKGMPGRGGWHVFSLAGYSADVYSGHQTPENSIPLQFLYRGAHHFIGSTTNTYFNLHGCQNIAGIAAPICHYGLTGSTGLVAQLYYLLYSEDPIWAFWSAKRQFAGLISPDSSHDYKMLHSFVYFGLPEGGSPSEVNRLPPRTAVSASCPSGIPDDCDGDEMPDSLEHWIVENYKPYLIFDENETIFQEGLSPIVYWQVSPAELGGTSGAWLTMITTYPRDWGVTRFKPNAWDDKYWWCRTIPCVVGGVLAGAPGCLAGALGPELAAYADVGPFLTGHAGDSEAIRFFITDQGGSWTLTHIDWKRHKEGFGSPVPVQYIEDLRGEPDPTSGIESHPVLYIARDKHAAYVSKEECERAVWDLTPWVPWCDIRFEQCGEGPERFLETPPERNVGERVRVIRTTTGGPVQVGFHLIEQLPEYPPWPYDEYAWTTYMFCGGQDPGGGLFDEDCAGGLGKMWYPTVHDAAPSIHDVIE